MNVSIGNSTYKSEDLGLVVIGSGQVVLSVFPAPFSQASYYEEQRTCHEGHTSSVLGIGVVAGDTVIGHIAYWKPGDSLPWIDPVD